MALYFFYCITLLSLFLAFVLSVSFFLTKKGVIGVNKILSVLIILFGVQIFYSFSISNYAYSYFLNFHKLLFIIRQTALLTGPCFYFYLQAFIKNRLIKPADIIHAIPFIGLLLFLSGYNNTIDNFVIWESKIDLYNTILILVHNLIYITLSIIKNRKINYSIAGMFKNLKTSSRTGWFQFILFGFITLWVINLNSFAIYMILRKPIWCAYTGSIYTLAFFLFFNSIMFILLLKPEIYFLIEKYKNSPIDEDAKSRYVQPLINYIDTRKPYLDSEITLENVAKDMSVNARMLSQIINDSFKNNFKGYMNEFRIRESIKQLSDLNNKKTILEILFDSGFNSKSVFYTEFKKHTGLTPQEFRAKYNTLEMAS